jgi:hypothetical protein
VKGPLAALAILALSGCDRGPRPILDVPVKACRHRFDYRVYRASLPGRILITPYEGDLNCLIALGTDGKVAFDRSFVQKKFTGIYPVTELLDFKPIGSGMYGYFVQKAMGPVDVSFTYHFLDSKFRDVFARAVPNSDPALNGHDVQIGPRGTYFFLFSRPRYLKDKMVVDGEVQEWGPQGPLGFRWSSKDSTETGPDAASGPNYLHLNSLELDSDGGLLFSFLARSEVVKVAYPSGRVVWRLSAATWKFQNDPLNGFQFQHSVRRLPNGNLLMFDNGSVERGGISRAVEYRLDEKHRIAELVWEYRNQKGNPFRERLGSVQRLRNGNTLICWGNTIVDTMVQNRGKPVYPLFTEVDSKGNVVRELLGDVYRSYRAWFDETSS